MPEAPDLQVIKEFLVIKLAGVAITEAKVLRPIVLRSLAVPPGDFPADVAGRVFKDVWRRGKFLGLELSRRGDVALTPGRSDHGGPVANPSSGTERILVINPMLSGGLRYCPSHARLERRTYLTLTLGDGHDLRYFDDDQMGMVYYVGQEQLPLVPRLGDQGPDVLDAPLSLNDFEARLRPFRGELKGVLTRGALVSGIGNAYSDEVLFAAGLFPFRKVTSLAGPERARLHHAIYSVPNQAVPVLRGRVGSDIHLKVRDLLQVHGKGGGSCPGCGSTITSITANGFLTNYCRHCQPGSLIGGRRQAGRAPSATDRLGG